MTRLAVPAALALAVVAPLVVSGYRVFQLTQIVIHVIALVGLNLLTGYSGQISLGHGAFLALGAYTGAIAGAWGAPPWAAAPLAGAVCFGAGLAFGRPAARLDGLYLALATFGLAITTPQLLRADALAPWTGGSQGVSVAPPRSPLPAWIGDDEWLYYLCLAAAVALCLVAWNLVRGRTGRALTALRDDPIGAAAIGLPLAHYRSLAFGVSAMFTGVAGALGALSAGFVSPDSFPMFASVQLLVGSVVGGVTSIFGALFGAVFLEVVPEVASSLSEAAPSVLYGVLLIACMMLMPGGAAGLVHSVRARLARRAGPNATAITRTLAAWIAVAAWTSGCKRPDAGPAAATPGVTATEIKIGQTMPYSGPASAYGVVGQADVAYFQMINAQGGIHGRKVTLISLDDGYSPPRTVEQTRKLIEREGVLLIFNSLGTATNTAVQGYLNARGVPQLFISTAADKWANPARYPWTMGWQPSYRAEARIYARYLQREHASAKLCVLYQNDDFGKDYLAGLRDVLGAELARTVIETASYEVTDPTVDSQIVTLHGAGCDALLTAATPKFAAQAIRKVSDLGWKPLHLVSTASSSRAAVLEPAGVSRSTGILTALYLKDPTDPSLARDPAIAAFRAFAEKSGLDAADANVLYGYAVSMTLARVLEQCGDDLSRDNVMKQAASLQRFALPVAQPGITIETSAADFRPFQQFQLSRFNGTSFEPVGPVQSE